MSLRLPSGGDHRLAEARHRRQRAVPRVPRRHRGLAKGTLVEYRAVAKDCGRPPVGDLVSYGVVGDPGPAGGGGGGVGPVTQPDACQRPRHHNSEMGCPGDWQPDCAPGPARRSTPRTRSGRAPTRCPAAGLRVQGRHQQELGRELRRGRRARRRQHRLHGARHAGHVLLRPRHALRHLERPGPDHHRARVSFQSELGCPADWSPACMRPWLQDPDGDGTYTWSSDQHAGRAPTSSRSPTASSWDENYGAGGAPNGGNIAFTVPADGMVVTISLRARDPRRHRQGGQRPGAAPDLTKQRAVWVEPGPPRLAGRRGPGGGRPALLRWRLHWSADRRPQRRRRGHRAVARPPPLTRDPRGLPAAVVAAHPELRLPGAAAGPQDRQAGARDPQGPGRGGIYDSLNRVLDATGVQIALVLDDLYAADAGKRRLRRHLRRPVADLPGLGADRAEGRPADLGRRARPPTRRPAPRRRTHLTRAVGRLVVRLGRRRANARYLYEVTRLRAARPARSRRTWSPTPTRSR